MIYAGIDLHPKNMVIVAINNNNEVMREVEMPTSVRSLVDFFSILDQPVQAVVECTCNWYWLSGWCRKNNIPLTLTHAKMVKAISYTKVKTDTVGGRALAC